MSKYRVKSIRGLPDKSKNNTNYSDAWDLRTEYGLTHLTIEQVFEAWSDYSDSMAAGWLYPDKESVESVFKVELELELDSGEEESDAL